MSEAEAVKELLATVKRNPDGTLKVLSPFGFKVADVGGEVCLIALTKEEATALVGAQLGKSRADAVAAGGCFTSDSGCVKQGCRGRCVWVFKGQEWVCVCEH